MELIIYTEEFNDTMDIESILEFLDDLEDDISEFVGRKVLGSKRYDRIQKKKSERRKRKIEAACKEISDIHKEAIERREKEKKEAKEYDRAFAKRMESRYKGLGIELDLEGLSFMEIMDEIEKANLILDKEDDDLDDEF